MAQSKGGCGGMLIIVVVLAAGLAAVLAFIAQPTGPGPSPQTVQRAIGETRAAGFTHVDAVAQSSDATRVNLVAELPGGCHVRLYWTEKDGVVWEEPFLVFFATKHPHQTAGSLAAQQPCG